jgi:hypothetical protein
MATPVESVIEAADPLLGYELTNAKDLAETIEAYSRLGATLNRALRNLANRVDENRSIDVRTSQDLADMAAAAMSLYETGQEAHHNFYDRNEFWLGGQDE